jgi:hypothetical protein
VIVESCDRRLTGDWAGVADCDGSDDTVVEAAGLSAAELAGVVLSTSVGGVELAPSTGAEVGVGASVVSRAVGLGVGVGRAGATVAAIPC